MHEIFIYFTAIFIAFLINIPCGYIREKYPKFSFKWFFWIHASIPLLIYIRVTEHLNPWIIPFSILTAITGQIIGSRWKQKRMSVQEREKIDQIDHLNIIKPHNIEDSKVLVALLNMGGPRTNDDVKDFQKHLFSDPLLIRFPLSFLFQKIFAWILIKVRLKAVKTLYQEIGGGSPIYKSTTAQAQALRQELKRRGRDIDVTFSFNYSPPFAQDTIEKAQRNRKKTLLALSLYPHFSKATTGSNLFYLKKAALKYPDINIINASSYYLHEGYIQAFIERINEALRVDESLDDFYLLFSAHGLPLYFLTEGDPYPFQIAETVAGILQKLNRTDRWVISYQSAVGPLQWLKPATDQMLKALARRGIIKIIVIPVSFVGDHIETISEINVEYRELAHHLGIHDFRMSKAIECHPGFIQALADTVEKSLISNETLKKNFSKNKISSKLQKV
ncbi:MAG: ferrochelatase [Candidatus Omnitrophica bacterium]|nr:ferrochelatase [Candidatus Omnitrophota bacterium]